MGKFAKGWITLALVGLVGVVAVSFRPGSGAAESADTFHVVWNDSFADVAGLTRAADLVIIGTVQTSTVEMVHDLPFTNYVIKVDRVISGASVDEVTVRETGGVVGNRVRQADDDPMMQSGAREVLFLRKSGDGNPWYWVVGGPQGRFHSMGGRIQPVDPTRSVQRAQAGVDEQALVDQVRSLH